jgi:hypothetical protein
MPDYSFNDIIFTQKEAKREGKIPYRYSNIFLGFRLVLLGAVPEGITSRVIL